jgi:hypothetical protein
MGFPVFPLDWKTEEAFHQVTEKVFPGSCNQLLALLGWNDGTEKNYSHWKN